MTCEKVRDSCSLFPELNCTYGCKIQHDNQGVCFCEHGYKLDVDNRTCIDINECALKSSCDHNCTNSNGSFECQCAFGFKLQNDGKSCRACHDYMYGEQCSGVCQCVLSNTKECDPTTGECLCETGWEGRNCSLDVDECKEKIIECDTNMYQVCINTDGAAHCECRFGGLNITSCNHPKPAHSTNQSEVKIKAETTFDIKISHREFLADSEKWRKGFETSLMKFYKEENVRGLSAVIILTIRHMVENHNFRQNGTIQFGSVIIDYEIIGSRNESKEMKTDLSSSMTKLLTGEKKMTVLDQAPVIKEIRVKDPDGTSMKNISVSSKPCAIFHGFGGTCPAGERCDDTIGIATCFHIPSSSTDISNMVLIMKITGGILALFIIFISVLVVCLYCSKRSKGKESTVSKSMHDSEPRGRGTPKDINLHSDTTTDYDVINPKNEYTNENEYLELAEIPLHFYGNTNNKGLSLYANSSVTNESVYETPYSRQIPRMQGLSYNSGKVRRYQRY
ncbi:uncharacterized protein LOC134241104 [Saccostrea cucullata]|uniref:uncharacterized protein LOC134241104 n=1 Tax=Saccostrea cuccullata TaxID=36930 RepID=UPI002ED4E77B